MISAAPLAPGKAGGSRDKGVWPQESLVEWSWDLCRLEPPFFLPRFLSVGDISVSFEHTWKPGQHSPFPLVFPGPVPSECAPEGGQSVELLLDLPGALPQASALPLPP